MSVLSPEHPAVRALGWALVHFVWQGALLAGLAALAMHLLRDRSPQARYAAGCAALLLMLAAPVATGIAAYGPAAALAAGPLPGDPVERQAVLDRLAAVARQVRPGEAWRDRVEAVLPSLVTVWLTGILVLSLRLGAGWGYAQRLARREVRPAAAAWQRRLDELAARLGVSRPVRLLESARVRVPTVVGWLRPVVLLPLAAASGLPPRQLEAILLHELAHVRRHDYLVNLVQSAVEVLLFYHPGAWWVSQRVREEREACCDDVAVAACGDALVYARALTGLEGLRAAPAGLALAADGGSLLHRVRRLVLPAPQPARGTAPLLLGVLLLATLAAAAAAQRALAPEPPDPPAAPAAPAASAAARPTPPSGPARPAGGAPAAPEPRPAPAPPLPAEAPRPSGSASGAGTADRALQEGDSALVARLRRIAGVESSGEKTRLLVALAGEATRDEEALDAYLDAAATIDSSDAQREALSALLGGGGAPAPRPARQTPATAATQSSRKPEPASASRRTQAPRAADTSLAGRLAEAERISSSSAQREALSALLREQAGRPE